MNWQEGEDHALLLCLRRFQAGVGAVEVDTASKRDKTSFIKAHL